MAQVAMPPVVGGENFFDRGVDDVGVDALRRDHCRAFGEIGADKADLETRSAPGDGVEYVPADLQPVSYDTAMARHVVRRFAGAVLGAESGAGSASWPPSGLALSAVREAKEEAHRRAVAEAASSCAVASPSEACEGVEEGKRGEVDDDAASAVGAAHQPPRSALRAEIEAVSLRVGEVDLAIQREVAAVLEGMVQAVILRHPSKAIPIPGAMATADEVPASKFLAAESLPLFAEWFDLTYRDNTYTYETRGADGQLVTSEFSLIAWADPLDGFFNVSIPPQALEMEERTIGVFCEAFGVDRATYHENMVYLFSHSSELQRYKEGLLADLRAGAGLPAAGDAAEKIAQFEEGLRLADAEFTELLDTATAEQRRIMALCRDAVMPSYDDAERFAEEQGQQFRGTFHPGYFHMALGLYNREETRGAVLELAENLRKVPPALREITLSTRFRRACARHGQKWVERSERLNRAFVEVQKALQKLEDCEDGEEVTLNFRDRETIGTSSLKGRVGDIRTQLEWYDRYYIAMAELQTLYRIAINKILVSYDGAIGYIHSKLAGNFEEGVAKLDAVHREAVEEAPRLERHLTLGMVEMPDVLQVARMEFAQARRASSFFDLVSRCGGSVEEALLVQEMGFAEARQEMQARRRKEAEEASVVAAVARARATPVDVRSVVAVGGVAAEREAPASRILRPTPMRAVSLATIEE